MSSSLRKFFPEISLDILEIKEERFKTKMKYLDLVCKDMQKYKKLFPSIPEQVLKGYYLEFLDRLDIYRTNYLLPFKYLDTIPEKIFIKIFRYIDFTDLIIFAMSNFVLYHHIIGFRFFNERLHWEREHEQYINYCLYHNKYQDLIYQCKNPIERSYKNQIILKRNLWRIDPPETHPLSQCTSFSVFRHFFEKKYIWYFDTKEDTLYQSTLAACFDKLEDADLKKYNHASAVAKRYGFIHCFRTMNWAATEEPPSLGWCKEKVVLEYLAEILGPEPEIKRSREVIRDSNQGLNIKITENFEMLQMNAELGQININKLIAEEAEKNEKKEKKNNEKSKDKDNNSKAPMIRLKKRTSEASSSNV